MADYDVITYTRPDGVTINLSDPPYTTYDYDGFGIGEFQHTTVAPPQLHGEYWYGTRMEAKILTVEFGFTGDGVVERQGSRRIAVNVFNPLLGPGTLRIDQANGVSREITCILAESMSLPSSEFVGTGHYRTLVRFKSHGIPAFVDPTVNEYAFNFAVVPGTFIFPFTLPVVFAQSGFGSAPTITNEGDIDTPVRIEMTGPFINPIFRNATTGRTIELAGFTVGVGQQLVIDTAPDRYVLTLDGIDVWQYAVSADMWGLAPGDNNLVFDVGGTTAGTLGTIKWYTRYLGQ